jgi:D-alanine-D-alanine ligase
MPRIGFAYNLKPAPDTENRLDDEATRAEEEPPSSSRSSASRLSAPPTSHAGSSSAPTHEADDEFAEWDSIDTIDAVANALSAVGTVIRLEADEQFAERLRAEQPDIVFNIAEGRYGVNREAHVPAICEFFDIPYSGSDPFALSLCLDKARTKQILSFHGIPTAPFAVIHSLDDLRGNRSNRNANEGALRFPLPESRFPIFVKPLHEGSSKGITERNLCRTTSELVEQVEFLLDRYRQPVLAETYLPGDEFTCAILGNGESARLLPIVGMRFDALPDGALPVYGYEAKWVWDRPENPLDIFECPARIDETLRADIERIVLDAYRVLGCRDWSRIDVRLDAEGVPNIVEVNPLPGILPNPADNSCFPKAARAAGMSYDELIQRCLLLAAARHGLGGFVEPRRGAHPRADARVAAQR